jgi:L-alanine-DL-glutamate epimerase-like enolase superfamily enzyme
MFANVDKSSLTVSLAHCHSPSHSVFCSTDFNSYVSVSLAETTAQRKQGRMAAPIAPGLGVTPRPEVLGKPVFQYPPPQGDC